MLFDFDEQKVKCHQKGLHAEKEQRAYYVWPTSPFYFYMHNQWTWINYIIVIVIISSFSYRYLNAFQQYDRHRNAIKIHF